MTHEAQDWTNKALKTPRWKPGPKKLLGQIIGKISKKIGNARKTISGASSNKNSIPKSISNNKTLHRCFGL